MDLVKIQTDGTVEVDLTKESPVASELLELRRDPVEGVPASVDYIITDYNGTISKLKIAMLVVGTRGDVQPFLAMAKRLQVCQTLQCIQDLINKAAKWKSSSHVSRNIFRI